MAIQDFTAGQVLTAVQMDNLQANDYNQTVSTKTASYTLVAADKGTRVVMNSASATTITVNTSLFSAGDTLILQNISTGVCTVTAGTATVSTAGSLAIPQNGSGLLYFTSAGVSIFYPSAGAQVASGLTFITGATFTTATSVSLPDNTFDSTYQNYRVIYAMTAVTGTGTMTGRYRASGSDNTTSRYFQMSTGIDISAVASNQAQSTASSFALGNQGNTAFPVWRLVVDFIQPNVSNVIKTVVGSLQFGDGSSLYGRTFNGLLDTTGSAFQVDRYSIISNSALSITGNYRVYGYANSQGFMTKPQIQIGDEVREMTDAEYAQWLADADEAEAQVEAQFEAQTVKLAERQTVLDKIGLTADEAAALLGQFGITNRVDRLRNNTRQHTYYQVTG